MLSTPNAKESDPHDVFVIDPEVVLAARAPSAARSEAGRLPAPQPYAADGVAAPSLDASFRATASDHIVLGGEPSPIARWLKRAAMAFTFALLSALAAAAWKHHGDTAKQVIADWVPQFSLMSLIAGSPAPADQAAPPAAATATETAAADPAAAQPDIPPQAQSTESAAPVSTAAATAPDSSQLLQSMAHDVAAMGQQIEQLKATIEQLKAGQDQMAREMARTLEARAAVQASPARTAPARPVAAPVRRPKPVTPPTQAAAAAPLPPPAPAPAPLQAIPAPQSPAQDGGPVVRPPLPVR